MAYTTIDDGSAYHQTALYSGTTADNTITNDGNSDLQPDLLWIKRRNDAGNTLVFDSSRGFNGDGDSLYLETTDDGAETHNDNDHLKSFNSDGFTVQGGSSRSNRASGDSFMGWQWKANGGSTTTNDASATGVGSVDSVYQANTTSGFSIVTWTGTGSAGTIAHGLGATPEVVILKSRDNAHDWFVGHNSMHSTPWVKYLRLHENGGIADDTIWNDTAPTSTVFSVGSYDSTNGNTVKFVAYCFKEIQGYSKFGSYTGNASTDGPFVYLGFKPAFFLLKGSDITQHWYIFDTTRDTYNPSNSTLQPSTDNAEQTGYAMDFLSNGFKIRHDDGAWNGSGSTYVYMAFAEHPFVSSEGVPTTAR